MPQEATAGKPLLTEETSLETAGLKGRGPVLEAIATLRGDDFVAPVLLRAPGGVLADYQAPSYGSPTVTVLGHERKRASVVFILDCSHSMSEPAIVEGPDASAR